jgi:hypothetical protein
VVNQPQRWLSHARLPTVVSVPAPWAEAAPKSRPQEVYATERPASFWTRPLQRDPKGVDLRMSKAIR